MRPAAFLVLPALLLGLACEPRPTGPGVYGPWEEGLTLTYEDPSQPTPEARLASRFQVRVRQGLLDPTKPGEVQLTETSLQHSATYAIRYEAGGRALLDDKGQPFLWLLPQGFPGKVSAWTDAQRGFSYRILGRAAWNAPFSLPPTVDPTGVWVEAARKDGLKRRTLFLQGLGEVETLEWRPGPEGQGGQWVALNRLTGRGFTDLPADSAR